MRKKRDGSSLNQLLKHIKENRPLTTFEVSRICGVVHSTISNWIDAGKLNAYKTPGGHRRIKKDDLLVFLKLYEIPVPKDVPLTSSSLPAAEEGPGREKRHEGNIAGKRVLLIVEDQVVSEVLMETLKKGCPDCEFVQASNEFQVGKSIAQSIPDLIVIDMRPETADGYRLIELLRKESDLANIKIIAVTDHNTEENREKILAHGNVDGFISKPMNLHKLKDLAQQLLRADHAA